jgi:uncharacterized protein (DUF433 family)
MAIVELPYIDVDERGVARVAGSRIKVRHLVMDRTANGGGPEDVQARYPHLSLAEVYAAFVYYFDHKAQIDAEIAEGERVYQEGLERQRREGSPVIDKLRALGKLP